MTKLPRLGSDPSGLGLPLVKGKSSFLPGTTHQGSPGKGPMGGSRWYSQTDSEKGGEGAGGPGT